MTSQLLTTIRRVAGVVLEYLPKVSEAAKRDLHSLRKRGYSGDIQVDLEAVHLQLARCRIPVGFVCKCKTVPPRKSAKYCRALCASKYVFRADFD